ncbi:MAG: CDP-alcohol phosphatidyltransferase family protein [Chloroflexota bacterium]
MLPLQNLLSVNYWKSLSSRLVSPLVNILILLRISPNMLTLLAFLSALASAYYLFGNQTLFIAFMLLNLLLDVLDGQLARKLETTSSFGDRFDKFSDSFFGVLLLIKTGIVLDQPLAYVGLTLYLLHMLLAGKAWYTLFGPNTTFLRISLIFEFFYLGIIAQILYTLLAMFGSLYYYRHTK